MKKFNALMLGLVLSMVSVSTSFAATGYPSAKEVRTLLNQPGWENYRRAVVGDQMTYKKTQVLRARYDYSVLGGSSQSSGLVLKDLDGKDAALPKGAIVSKALIYITNSALPTSASIAVAAEAANDLKTATAASSYVTGFLASAVTGATVSQAFKLSNNKPVKAFITTAPLTAGKFDVYIEYYVTE